MTETVQELQKLFRPPSTRILVNVEQKSKYPFIIFGPLASDFDTRRFAPTSSCKVLSPELRINDGIYDVCGSILRPGSGFSERDASVQAPGFVISAFQTFPGEDSQRLEENWITWTGKPLIRSLHCLHACCLTRSPPSQAGASCQVIFLQNIDATTADCLVAGLRSKQSRALLSPPRDSPFHFLSAKQVRSCFTSTFRSALAFESWCFTSDTISIC